MINNYTMFESADLINVIDNIVSFSNVAAFKRDMTELLKIHRKQRNLTKPIRVSIYTVPFIDDSNKSFYILQKDTDVVSCEIQKEYSQLRDRIKTFSSRPATDNNDKIMQSHAVDVLPQILHMNVEGKQQMLSLVKTISTFISTSLKKIKNTMLLHELVSLVFDI